MESIKEGKYEPKLSPLKHILPVIKDRIDKCEHGSDDLTSLIERWIEFTKHRRLKGKSDEYLLFFTINHGIKDSSMAKYISILNKHFEKVKGMTPYQLYQYILKIDKSCELSKRGVQETYSKLMQVFNRIYGYEHFIPLKKTVTTKVGRDEFSTIFNKSNFDAWLKVIKRKNMHEDALMFHLMWELALRPCELLLIRFEDIVSEDGKYVKGDRCLHNKS